MEKYCSALDDEVDVESAHRLNEYSVLLAVFGDPRYACSHVHIRIQYVCMYVRMYVHTCVLYSCTHAYIYMYTADVTYLRNSGFPCTGIFQDLAKLND